MKPHIIIILMDTLRKDAFDKWLKEYNGEYKSIVENSFIFENARAPSSWTLPSHMSLFTGLYPSEHGIHERDKDRTLDTIYNSRNYSGKFLMDFAEENGYSTSGFSANPVLSLSGIAGGFNNFFPINSSFEFQPEVFLLRDDFKKYLQISSKIKAVKFLIKKNPYRGTIFTFQRLLHYRSELLRPTCKYFRKIVDKFKYSVRFDSPQFIFFNFMEMHEPYTRMNNTINIEFENMFGYKKLNKANLYKIRHVYFKQIWKLTYIFDSIISKLISEDQLENSIIIITSDHGQALNEMGYYGHGIYNYDEISRIPLFIHIPEKMTKSKIYDKQINTSLVNLYDFIKDIIINENMSLDKLKSNIVVCESYGIPNNIPPEFKDKPNFETIKKRIDVPRKSLFRNNIKLTLNASGEVEEFNGTERDYIDLIDFLSIFTVDHNFTIPEV